MLFPGEGRAWSVIQSLDHLLMTDISVGLTRGVQSGDVDVVGGKLVVAVRRVAPQGLMKMIEFVSATRLSEGHLEFLEHGETKSR